MDKNRLEELKRLLQKRHQEPKRSLEQNSNGENFKVPNSETLNFEASNFETQNSKIPNSEASNSETPDSDPDALNLEAEADQNSACVNNAEPQNFISDDSGSLWQNSKVRDYDKNPLVIKDHTY